MTHRNQEFQTIRSEGGLLPPDLLRRVLDQKSKLDGIQPEDYRLPKGVRLNEVITQSWSRLRRFWTDFRTSAAKMPGGEPGTRLTNDKWSLPLLRELGFGLLPTSAGPEIGGRTYAISRFFGPVPVHLVGCGLSLDHRAAGVRGAAVANPHGLVQDFLNRSDAHLWAIVSNGLRLRVLRDSQALSRQSFLEFDLEAMFDGEVYPDFVLLWLTAHATRFDPRDAGRPETCWLEQWTRRAKEQGTRALGDLRGGVERALQALGEGFTSHPRNAALRDALRTGELPLTDYHGQLLRVVYRLIFLFVAEDRVLEGQPLLHPRDESDSAHTARQRYAAHYGTVRLRDLAGKIKGSRHGDLWQQFQVVAGALSGTPTFAAAREHLALPLLGSSIWDRSFTMALNDTDLTNHDFLEALRHLAFTRQGKMLRPVDFRNLGAEELGGVYEGLLALTPQISGDGARFSFAEFAGNERKTSGSYYTPDSLVQCLLDSALDPVVEEAIKDRIGSEAERAILTLKVCDPAVGSGHFLVGAAHRLGRHLARVRALAQGEAEPSPLLYQQALRDVIGRCLYGVDVNPMAAELCRVGLWLEALEPGKPLSFLDHHIRVGNSLLGATPELIAAGLPDDAFNPIEGDDKKLCSGLKKRNRQEREGQHEMLHLVVAEPRAEYASIEASTRSIDEAPDDTIGGIHRKKDRFYRLIGSPEYQHAQQVADAWCAALVCKKQPDAQFEPITTDTLRRLEHNVETLTPAQRVEVEYLSRQYRFFHWHLAFPEVFARGGFDCVLGNPPWVRQELFKPIKNFLTVYASHNSTADLSVFFLELAVRIVSLSGTAAMLTPNKWLRSAYGEELRGFLRTSTRVRLIIDFGHAKQFFGDADTFPACVVLSRVDESLPDQASLCFVRAFDEDRARFSLSELVAAPARQVTYKSLAKSGWTFSGSPAEHLMETMRANYLPLADYVGSPPLYGLKTGFNEAFYLKDDSARMMITEEPQSKELIKPFIRGRDIKRWNVIWANQWHIVIASSQNRPWPWSRARDEREAEAIFSHTYPLIHCHLKRYEERLRMRTDQGLFWWELRSCDYYARFTQPKIVVPCIAYYSEFALDNQGYWPNNKVILIASDDPCLLAILNSRVIWWLMSHLMVKMKDNALSLDAHFLARLPIPSFSQAAREEVRPLVGQIGVMASNGMAHPSILEAEKRLNLLVEEAFAMTQEERDVMISSLPARDPLLVAAGKVGSASGTQGEEAYVPHGVQAASTASVECTGAAESAGSTFGDLPLVSGASQETRLAKTGVLPLPSSWTDSNGHPVRAGFKFRGYTLVITTEEGSQDWRGIKYAAGAASIPLPGNWFGQAERVTVVEVGNNLEVTRVTD